MKQNQLQKWQERLSENLSAYQLELNSMDRRQALYNGTRGIQVIDKESMAETKNANTVRNIVTELIEAQVDSSIPMPKVSARRQEDEERAKTIEDYLRNETDRLPFEKMNDLDERITPIQGGDYFLVEWDADRHTHTTRGELTVTLLHPKQVIPQNGVADIEDMDYIFVRIAMTKDHVREQYGIDVSQEGEEAPEVRGNGSMAEDLVTVNFAYYRNKEGGIGRYVWVNDIELEHLTDYQARMLDRCRNCGEVMEKGKCPYCGGTKAEKKTEDYFVLPEDVTRSDGSVIPAWQEACRYPEGVEEILVDPYTGMALEGVPELYQEQTRIPYYKPDVYPVVLRRNVSAFGKNLGDSDVDKIQDQQNAIKKCDSRVQDKLGKGGSILTLQMDTEMEYSDRQLKIVRVNNPSDLSCIRLMNLQADASGDMAVAEQAYQAARNILGITDSFQGRQDRTATSGTAKQIAVAQSAGRLESKRIMKNAMYADLYEVMFKFLLAYSDEPRTVRRDRLDGTTEYSMFNKYDFLERDDAGEWYWIDDFLFSVDTSSALASNREAMWQETRQNFQNGTFGNPQNTETLLLFWSMMAKLHYPMAEETKTMIEQQLQQQQMAQQQMIQQQMAQPMAQPGQVIPEGTAGGGISEM